jgi:glycosyltransferase involved in cell wall biosynthesis
MKKVLFLSAIDFKEKSIQVIRKTPEAYFKEGWEVDYVVARDNVSNGNYYYENEINPNGLNIYRFYWPLNILRAKNNRYINLLFSKISSIYVVFRLALIAKKLIKEKQYDVIYGYELQGVLAMNIIKKLLPKDTRTVSRFQGTFLNEMLSQREYFRLFFNLDLIIAVRCNSDLLIMTDDGTQGKEAVNKIKKNKPFKMVFWTNGVDYLPKNDNFLTNPDKKIVLMSISRLVNWKKVERNIYIVNELLKLSSDIVYYIIGDGEQKSKLMDICLKLNINENVIFVGALRQEDVFSYLKNADFFLSMYDSSNVGNPLLEAIRANKIIVTLSNGDTGKWIKHKVNGLIYEPNSINYTQIAKDIFDIMQNESLKADIKKAVIKTEFDYLLTWEERLNKEVKLVSILND